MKTLNTLIRYRKQALDELRRKMGALENQKQQLMNRTDALRKELETELRLASSKPEMGAFFGNFAQRILRRQEEILVEVMKLEKQMTELSLKIQDGFGEVKKLEITRDRRLEALREKEAKRDMAQLDEVAQQRFRGERVEN